MEEFESLKNATPTRWTEKNYNMEYMDNNFIRILKNYNMDGKFRILKKQDNRDGQIRILKNRNNFNTDGKIRILKKRDNHYVEDMENNYIYILKK